MHHHQSRANRKDSKQRRSARPGGGTAHPRASAGKGSGTEGQGPSATATPLLSPAAQPAPGASSNRSDGVNGQARGHVPRTYEVPESPGAQQNIPFQQQVPQVSNVQSGIRTSNGTVAKSSRPGTPSSSSVSTEVKPVIPKPDSAWNAVHPQLSFQFGSIGPSVGTCVQIPARTSSAPPNLDEQKQVLQSLAGPPLMGPPLAPLPSPMPPTQMTQMSHQLPGGLAPGMPVAPLTPYWVVPVANPVIPPRTSSAVKIVHPETLEELKFDYKSSKTDTCYDNSVPVTAAVPQSRIVGNGPSHTRPSSGYASGSHHSLSQNVYTTQQNGHHYQPSGIASKQAPGTKVSPATSREETAGLSDAAPRSSGSSNSVPQATISCTAEKQNLLPATSPVHEAVDTATLREGSPGLCTAVASSMSGPSSSVSQGVGSSVCEKQDLLPDNSPVSAAVDEASSSEVTLGSSTAVSPSVSGPSNSSPQAAAACATSEKHFEAVDTETSREVTMGSSAELTPSVSGPSNSASEAAVSAMFEKLDLSPAISPVSAAVHTATSLEVTLSESGPSNSLPQAAVDAISEKQDLLSAISPLQEAVDTTTSREVSACSSTALSLSGPSNFVPQAVDISEKQDIAPTMSPDSAATNAATSMEVTPEVTSAADPSVSLTSSAVPQAAVDVVSEKQELLPATSPTSAATGTTMSGEVTSGVSTEVAPSVSGSSTFVLQVAISNLSEKQDLLPPAVSPVSAAPLAKQGSKKKKMKNILAKADAAGTTADLYNAYKAPEAKEVDEVVPVKVGMTKASINDLVKQEVIPSETVVANELDDWEDAVELPTPKVSTEAVDGGRTGEKLALEVKGGETYTRDFLLTFKEQSMELPLDFEVRPDIADLLLNPQAAFAHLADRDMHSGRMLDRQLSGGPRRSLSNTFDDDRWARPPQGQHSPLWPDNYADMGPSVGFRPGSAQGLISRMPSNIRSGITVPPLVPGLVHGKPLTPGSGLGLFRTNTVDSDRWQRMPSGQKGLIPSPQTPFPPVHKAEKRYEVGKASDEEEVKQRQIKGILNKLTPQNFQKLFEQVKGVNIQSAITLTGVISQIFDKALTEPTFCEMYATFCKQLAADMPEFIEDGDRVTFKRVLLNKCQEEFHRGEREQAEAAMEEEEGDNKMGAEEREEKRLRVKRRMLGNIRFIGELYKKQMLTERIMHECIRKLLGDYENPEEEDVEALCKLMSTIGYMIDQSLTRDHMDAYLERITRLSNNQKLSARMRFMLKDVIDLRRNGWQERRKVEGPKKIEEVHRDAVQERQATVAQAGRLSRLPSIGTSSGRRLVPPPDLNIRGGPTSPMFAPITPMGMVPSTRGGRSPFMQDVRIEDRMLLQNRTSTMPLSQRSSDEGL